MTPKLKYLSAAFLLAVLSHFNANAQGETDSTQTEIEESPEIEILPDDPVLQAIDQLWQEERFGWQNFEADSICLNKYGFEFGEIPSYPDSVVAQRLAELDKLTPLHLDYNNYVKAFIRLYTDRKRGGYFKGAGALGAILPHV